jgi:hypothetical protein
MGLKEGAAGPSEMLASTYNTTWYHKPENHYEHTLL